MNIIAIFILGVLIGWIVEWILDWFFWRGRINRAANENTELRERIISLEDELNKRPDPSITTPLTSRTGKDNLQAINGIGPAFSKRLNEAGINTFQQLSQLPQKEMERILGTLFKRFFSEDNTIIEQAKKFAKQKAKSG
jgi:predicted flap endonuclease-1-like 5' DNA nuclease